MKQPSPRTPPHDRSTWRRAHAGPALALLLGVLAGCRSDSSGTPARSAGEGPDAAGNGPRERRRHDAATFYSTTAYQGASFSHDGKSLLVTSDQSGVFNAYAVELTAQGGAGAWRALTNSSSDSINSLSWFPRDNRFLYTADQGGNELHHVFVGLPDGNSADLTPGPKTKARFEGWAGDQASFFIATNERDPQFFDLYRYREDAGNASGNVAPGFSRELLFQNPGGYELSAVSKDGAWVALGKVHDNANSDLFVARTSNAAELLHATPHQGNGAFSALEFSPDGKSLFYLSNLDREYSAVWCYDLASATSREVFSADWDVADYSFSEDGRTLAVSINADARTQVRLFEASTGAEIPLPPLSGSEISGIVFERGTSRLACYAGGDRTPPNLHVLDLGNGSQAKLTQALSPAIQEQDLVESEVVRFPSFDGLLIPSLLYRPHGASAATPAPAMLWIHGGPGGQSRGGYNPTIQHLVNHGYTVLAVNNRGSSGYGKTFYHQDDRAHGNLDLEDCVAARRYLEGFDWVDGQRIGIMGGSYGGYMVCAALAFSPNTFDCGIDIFGVTNWIRTLESIPPWWASIRASLYMEIGDPVQDRERLLSRSPLVHAKNIAKPLLVIQGKNDPRVLEAESREMAAAVEASGVPVEYVLFPDEGHGFRKKANRIRASESYLAFLEKYLRGK
ncbi:MAG: S9 family peptidase [Planctomycetes bacterium]|nr:S9 family peptidase [Planctomycetota bacterium]